MFAVCNYVWEIAAKKSCKPDEYGLFEHLYIISHKLIDQILSHLAAILLGTKDLYHFI